MKLILDILQTDVNTAAELAGFAMGFISTSVFIALLLHDALVGFFLLLRDIVCLICDLLERRFKFFRTFGKRKGGVGHGKKSST